MPRIAPHQYWYRCGEIPMFETYPVFCYGCRMRAHIQKRLLSSDSDRSTALIRLELKECNTQYPCEKRVQYSPIKY